MRLFSRPDVVRVVARANSDWILGAICRELAARLPGRNLVYHGDGKHLPRAHAYFFSHPWFFQQAPPDVASRSVVFFTHPRDGIDIAALARARVVVSMSSLHARALAAAGVETRVIIPGADPDQFRAHERGGGVVGLSSAYQARKAPAVVLGLPALMPHRRFLLLGRGWEAAPEFAATAARNNFEYVEAPYSQYPRHYDRMDVFVSPSEMEGGPMPLLEAMMANAVPVATRTGFGGDLINDGRNGVLVDVGAPPADFVAAIDRAATMSGDVRKTVVQFTWDRFAREVGELLDGARDRAAYR